MKKLMFVLLAIFAFGFYSSNIFAEDPAPKASDDKTAVQPAAATTEEEPVVDYEGAEFSYGTVKSASATQLVVSEYDYENDKDADMTYSITPETTFDGVKAAAEIAAGDSVDIDYELKGDQKVALSVAVEKGSDESEDQALETGTDQPEAGAPDETAAAPEQKPTT